MLTCVTRQILAFSTKHWMSISELSYLKDLWGGYVDCDKCTYDEVAGCSTYLLYQTLPQECPALPETFLHQQVLGLLMPLVAVGYACSSKKQHYYSTFPPGFQALHLILSIRLRNLTFTTCIIDFSFGHHLKLMVICEQCNGGQPMNWGLCLPVQSKYKKYKISYWNYRTCKTVLQWQRSVEKWCRVTICSQSLISGNYLNSLSTSVICSQWLWCLKCSSYGVIFTWLFNVCSNNYIRPLYEQISFLYAIYWVLKLGSWKTCGFSKLTSTDNVMTSTY